MKANKQTLAYNVDSSNGLSPMHLIVLRFLALSVLVIVTMPLFAQDGDVSKWIEIPCPKDSKSAEGALWAHQANQSRNVWHVFRDGQKVCATLAMQTNLASEVPKFTVEVEHFVRASATLKVSDGWLVGFNRGEWGGALYWFSEGGTTNYKISKHSIVDFVKTSNGISAIEGVGHMGLGGGSIISISQSSNQAPWQVATVCRLPQAPCAVVQHPDGTLLVALSDSFVSVALDGKIKTIVKEGRWETLSPNSVVLSDDTKTAYIGMRQFVAKITLKNESVSFLIPDRNFLNQLPKE